MREPANIDAIIDLMDRTPEEMDAQNVPAPVRDRILRIRALYAWWLINPRKTDQELVFKDMQDYKVQRMMAYNDLHLIKLILGNLQKVSKDFARYRFDQMIQRTYEKADNMGDARAMAAAAAAYVPMAFISATVAIFLVTNSVLLVTITESSPLLKVATTAFSPNTVAAVSARLSVILPSA